ncbi:hypothetical protein BZA70DRAFT_271414 [Myxozyma melibiosi]|uniref:RCC1/BLIP-II n=1 Tax=Myxozyma melibiosi TaxID=54550 RepID=A0ABR1FCJ9_9ASCO
MPRTWLFALGLDLFSQLSGAGSAGSRPVGNSTSDDDASNEKEKEEEQRGNGTENTKSGYIDPPRMIAVGQDLLRILWAGWNDTLLQIDDIFELRGFSAGSRGSVQLLCPPGISIVSGFGWTELQGVVCSDGEIYSIAPPPTDAEYSYLTIAPEFDISDAFSQSVQHVSVAGNGLVSVLHADRTSVTVFDSYASFKNHTPSKPTHKTRKEFKPHHRRTFISVRSAESHFVALDSNGCVWSWGAPNLHGELLRPTPANRGADHAQLQSLTPRIVPALEGIQMIQIAANGWVTACLSGDTRDVYIWGWMAGGARVVGMPATSGGELAGIIDQFDEEENMTVDCIGVANGAVATTIEDAQTGITSLYVARPPVEGSLVNDRENRDEDADGARFEKVRGPWDALLEAVDEVYRRPYVYCSPAATFVIIARDY